MIASQACQVTITGVAMVVDWLQLASPARSESPAQDRRVRLRHDAYLPDVVNSLLDRLSPEHVEVLQVFLKQNPEYSFGSACSGTDCPAMVLAALQSAFSVRYSQVWRVKHEFSAEKARRSRTSSKKSLVAMSRLCILT